MLASDEPSQSPTLHQQSTMQYNTITGAVASDDDNEDDDDDNDGNVTSADGDTYFLMATTMTMTMMVMVMMATNSTPINAENDEDCDEWRN